MFGFVLKDGKTLIPPKVCLFSFFPLSKGGHVVSPWLSGNEASVLQHATGTCLRQDGVLGSPRELEAT